MIRKATILILSLLILATFNVACNLFCGSDSCGCGSPGSFREFYIKGFNTSDIILSSYSLDTTTYYDYRERFKAIEIIDIVQSELIESKMNGIFRINALYACSPVPPRGLDTFSNISIINRQELEYNGKTFSEGEDISQLFRSEMYTYYYDDKLYLRISEAPNKETDLLFDIIILLNGQDQYLLNDRTLLIK